MNPRQLAFLACFVVAVGGFAMASVTIGLIGVIGAFVVLTVGAPYTALGCPHCGRRLFNQGPRCRGCGRDMRVTH